MGPFFLLLTLLVLVAGLVSVRRRRTGGWTERIEREPWAASLRDEDEDAEPLDEEAIRRAEDAFLEDRWEGEDDRPWS